MAACLALFCPFLLGYLLYLWLITRASFLSLYCIYIYLVLESWIIAKRLPTYISYLLSTYLTYFVPTSHITIACVCQIFRVRGAYKYWVRVMFASRREANFSSQPINGQSGTVLPQWANHSTTLSAKQAYRKTRCLAINYCVGCRSLRGWCGCGCIASYEV